MKTDRKLKLRTAQDGLCAYCGTTLPEDPSLFDEDHRIPKAKGGKTVLANLVAVCVPCNNQKSDTAPEEWAGREEKPPRSVLAMLVEGRAMEQRMRIRWGNRILAMKRFNHGTSEALERYQAMYKDMEREFTKDVTREVRRMTDEKPILDRLLAVPGIGEVLAARIIVDADIERAPTISAFWRFYGYAVADGKRERMQKGERRHYNIRAKIAVRNAVESFIKLQDKSAYARLYYERKARRQAQGWGKSDGHRHNDAIGFVAKVFLSHLWLTWRKLEGLPISQPYSTDMLEHQHVYAPEEFGWRAALDEKPA